VEKLAMEVVTNGINREWLFNNQVLVYKINAISAANLIPWGHDVVEILEDWPSEKPCLLLYDLTQSGVAITYLALTGYDIFNVGITSAGRHRVKTLIDSKPNFTIRLSLALSNSVSGKITMGRGRPTGILNLQIRSSAFFNREAALKWLIQSSGITVKENDQ
jgi:hypothetical protein